MSKTPTSLLERLRVRPDEESWRRLVELYTPLLRGWLARYPISAEDAEDLVQQVLEVLVRELPRFCHLGRPGSFRHWLRVVLVHRLRNFWRERRTQPLVPANSDFRGTLDQLEDPASALSQLWNHEHDRYMLRRLLELLEPEFEATTWQAFRLVSLEGQKAAAVAVELGISRNAVFIAKSRVLRRLRQELAGLID